MEIVAHHLQKEAIFRSDGNERDCFGRTAFNRYYYAVFLDVKSGLSTLNHDWDKLAHATIPELLRGSIKKKLKRGQQQAIKNSDSELVKLCGQAIAATDALANLLDQGRATRVTADYHPDVPVDFSIDDNFYLNTVAVTEAQSWPHRARSLIKTITSAWKQISD